MDLLHQENEIFIFFKKAAKINYDLLILNNKVVDLKIFKSVDYGVEFYFRKTKQEEEPSFNFRLVGELNEVFNEDVHSLGLELEMFYSSNDTWIINGFVGWYGYEKGVDSIETVESEHVNASNALNSLASSFLLLKEKFIQIIDSPR